jgi:hypothetical protein
MALWMAFPEPVTLNFKRKCITGVLSTSSDEAAPKLVVAWSFTMVASSSTGKVRTVWAPALAAGRRAAPTGASATASMPNTKGRGTFSISR